MVSDLFFSALVLCALLWLCVILHDIWPKYYWLPDDTPYGQKIETRRFTGRCMLIIAPSLACPIARSMCSNKATRYQSKETGYAESFGSCVTRVKPSWWAWAMRRRSKGSLWCRGKLSKA